MEGRKLGFWETGAALLHEEASGAGTLFASAHIRGKIDPALLKEALYLLFERHPLLRATIQEEGEELYFRLNADFASIPVLFLPRRGQEHFLTLGEEEMGQRFPTKKYLWKVTLLSEGETNELLLLFHHSIIDGFSCVHFIDELLRLYTELDLQTFGQIEPLPLLPSVEQLLAVHPSKEAIAREMTALLRRAGGSIDYQTFAPFAERKTKNQIAVLPLETLQKIKTSCSQRKLNVNSLLYASLLLSLRKFLGKSLDPLVITPINLRHFCEPKLTEEPLGGFISYVSDCLGPVEENTQLWQLAERYEKRLHEQIPKLAFLPAQFQKGELARIAPLFFDIAALKDKRAFTSACCVTNKGHFAFPDLYGALKLEAFFVTSSRVAGQTMINLSVTSVLDRMFLCFSYCHPLACKDSVEAIAKECLTLLSRLE